MLSKQQAPDNSICAIEALVPRGAAPYYLYFADAIGVESLQSNRVGWATSRGAIFKMKIILNKTWDKGNQEVIEQHW
jgi:hypothetical protein